MATFRQHVQAKHDQNRQWFNQQAYSKAFSGMGRRIDVDISCYQLLRLHDQIVCDQLVRDLSVIDAAEKFDQLEAQLQYWEE